MRKTLTAILFGVLFVAAVVCSACGEGATYYPDQEEMTHNLTANGYQVYATTWLVEGEGNFLSAEKGEDFLKFYWLNRAEDCDKVFAMLEESYPDSEVKVQMENDATWGNLVYFGTTNAVNAAGIKKVTVKVDVKV